MVPEAQLTETDDGLVADGEGWYVVNAREARWIENDEFGRATTFEGEPGWPELGLNVNVLAPGQPICMYHGEENQEGYLVLTGEATLLIEGQERPLKAWDYVHLPPWTEHVVVGAGSRPCIVLAVGSRGKEGLRYPVVDVAKPYDACVLEETNTGREAYARFSATRKRRYAEGDLPDW